MMKDASERMASVLLVEDNPAEQNLARRSLEKGCVKCDLTIVSDGEKALDFLFCRGEWKDRGDVLPDLILLDLNLPKIDGKEVLRQIKADPKLRVIPVVVLTTSKKEEDVIRTYELGCNSFLQKPVEVDDFIKILREIGSYWFKVVVLPPVHKGAVD